VSIPADQQTEQGVADELKEFTVEELQRYNGQDGKPVYITYNGKVYDVSESKMWRSGTHMRRHAAGTDLSGEIVNAPHETDVLERFPQVGILETPAEVSAEEEFTHLPGFVARLLVRFPFFERHPHPMTVHFPISLNFVAPTFLLLYLVTGVRTLETAAFYVLIAGVFFSLVAIPTGFLTWWINYQARPMKPVIWKITLSVVLFAAGLAAVILRWQDPSIAITTGADGILYIVLVFMLLPIVSVIGSIGALLTFPLPRKDEK
jgi:predicted heme/steroid binding protein/uncharacterized membrane protein